MVGTSHRSPGPVPLDVRDRAAVAALVAELRPGCVIHTAYLQDGPDAWATNVEGSRERGDRGRARPGRGWCTSRPTSCSTAAPAGPIARMTRSSL